MRFDYTEERPLRVCTTFSGYDSQCMALDRIGIPYELVAWCEIDKYAIAAHNAVYPQWADRNLGDITKVDWAQVPDFDLFTYSSPCFIAGTLVRTDKGLKPIESITRGDRVLTHTNAYNRVLTPMTHGYRGGIVHLAAMCTGEITCTANHRFFVRRLKRTGHRSARTFLAPEWREAGELSKDYYLGLAINREERLPEWHGVENNQWGHHRVIDNLSRHFGNPDFWYLMGRYVGDGWKKRSPTGCGIIICCSPRNRETLLAAITRLGFNYSEAKERTVNKVVISSNELFAFVERYGYYAHGKMIDGETLNLPVHLLRFFINGYEDSDGSMTGNLHKITTVSRVLAHDIVACVAKAYHAPAKLYFTRRPECTTIEGRTVRQRDSWQVVWKTEICRQDHAFYEDGHIWFPIRKTVHDLADTIVYNMEVEGDNSYTANGAIVHNCQDYSTAGLQRGGAEGSGTRSSLLWECKKAILAKRPKYLLQENVKGLVSEKFIRDFRKWEQWLAEQGYDNFCKVLNAKDYGVPQNRERIFMVSCLDDTNFRFPDKVPLTTHLEDLLERNVGEEYYLTEKTIEGFRMHNERHEAKGTGFMWTPKDIGGGQVANCLRANAALNATDNSLRVYAPTPPCAQQTTL